MSRKKKKNPRNTKKQKNNFLVTRETQPPATSPDSKEKIQIKVQQLTHQGPLPLPQLLEQYDRVLPGCAERIVAMAEKEQGHAHAKETRGQEGDIAEAKRGQIFGLIIGLFTIFSGAYVAVRGHHFTGGFISTAGVVGLVSVFILGRKK